MNEPIHRLAVIGAGIMGGGIAGVAAQQGIEVRLHDADPEAAGRALQAVEAGLTRDVKRKRLTEKDRTEALSRLHAASDLEVAVRSCDFVIEAVVEKQSVKAGLFAQLDELLGPDTILASNTSQLSITGLAAFATLHPERVIGMHWFNPPARMQLIEVIPGLQTSQATVERTRQFSRALGKTPIVAKDRRGFVVNRALGVFLAECFRMLEEDLSSAEEIDTAIKLGLGHPMGPFELADLIGLDTMLNVSEEMYSIYGERRLPSQLLRLMVSAGRLGRKSGHGFYTYDENGIRQGEKK